MRRLTAGAVLAVLCVLVAAAGAQEQPGDGGARSSGGGRVLLVLPFDNRTGQPSLEWMREAAAEILSMRFASAGFQPTSRADRVYALDHLGLPHTRGPLRIRPSRRAQILRRFAHPHSRLGCPCDCQRAAPAAHRPPPEDRARRRPAGPAVPPARASTAPARRRPCSTMAG